jgi:hypothetical protein
MPVNIGAATEVSPAGLRNQKMLLGVLFGLSAADGFITRFIISEGLGREGNLWLSALSSSDMLIAVKILAAGLATYLLWLLYPRIPRLAQGVTIAFVCWYTLIVFWNTHIVVIMSM